MKQIITQFSMNVQISLLMAWLLLASIFIVLLPDGLAQSLNMLTLRSQLSPYLSIAIIVSASYFIAKLLLFIHFKLTNKTEQEEQNKRMMSMIKRLDFEEKAVLREYIIQRKNMLSLPLNEPAVANLLEAGVLVPALSTQEINGERRIVKLSINLAARPLLTHKLLGLPQGKMTEAEVELLKSARPEYARQNFIGMRS
ncbi:MULTISPECIES: superinfection exclusion B family protein [unclassified Motilimonas]|uniref:superinfection exclusion B family protein n=1 Tax=Motilimonas TaxID=1914248 RepID=UPI001E39CAFF|nr:MULTISPECIES: superinfection exclusion B family protein [unclassified Motilimonas]MCE0557074.1 superinfection exclusion B family protein [Motilimonas sp. E26]MDO6524306.1 superinfection exclusion B family protein [Motilimonas sp. 1_MG-2023]